MQIIGWLFVIVIAGISIWFAAKNPAWIASLVAFALNQIIPDILKRKSLEEEAKDHEKVREGLPTETKAHGHGGENH